jgi:signal transduction histidine kinase
MEIRNDLPGWLHRCSSPAFSVKENIITACNQSAETLLLTPGTDIRELLLTGKEEYAAFQNGCLYLKLKLSPKGCGASVTREDHTDLFLLDQEPEDADLRSLALAARELRNPLSNLMIAADALKTLEDPGLRDQLARLNRSLHQMHRLINNMSDAGRNDLLTPAGIHDWDRFIRDIFEKIQTQLENTRVTLIYDGLSAPVYGLVNSGQMERAVLNIVSNAIKFMPEGGTIHAELIRKQNMLHLSIRDSGSGIAENVLGNVFTRYQRQPGIEDSRYGIGLGMVLIRNAAADHGGTVLIDRPEGSGTRVTMTMAIRQDAPTLRTPVLSPLVEGVPQILTELSEILPWECYKK